MAPRPPFTVKATGKSNGLDWTVSIRGVAHHVDQNGTATPPVTATDQGTMRTFLNATAPGIGITTNVLYTYCIYADPALSGNPSGRTTIIPGIPGPFDPNAPINKGGQAVAGTISSITDFLNLLTSPALWLRIGEVVLGLVLLGVGMAKLTNAGPALRSIPLYGKAIPA